MKKPWEIDDKDYDECEKNDIDEDDFMESLWKAMEPNEFYFAFSEPSCNNGGVNEVRQLTLTICPKEYYDLEGCIYDQHPLMGLVTDKWPQYLYELMEAMYEVNLSGSDEEKKTKCRDDLEKLGLKHNPDMEHFVNGI